LAWLGAAHPDIQEVTVGTIVRDSPSWSDLAPLPR